MQKAAPRREVCRCKNCFVFSRALCYDRNNKMERSDPVKKAVSLLLCVIFCLSVCTGEASALWSSSGWEKAYDLDPFGDATEDYYLGMTQRASGSYKSSSVTDGALEAELRVDANRICILLFENGRDQVRNGEHSAVAYTVLMKAADGSKTQLYGAMASGGDCVEIWEDQAGNILHFADAAPEETSVAKALCTGDGEVSFYLTREDQPATSDLFTVKTGNVAALYEAEIVPPIQEVAYAYAEQYLAENAFDDAESLFTALGDYRDSAARAEDVRSAREEFRKAAAYAHAEALLTARDFDAAIAAFTALGDYCDSAAKAEEAIEAQKAAAYAEAEARLAAMDYAGAIAAFTALGDYRDSADRLSKLEVMTDYTRDFYMLLEAGDIYSAYDWLEVYQGDFPGRDHWLQLLNLYKPFCDDWVLFAGDPTLIPLTTGHAFECMRFNSRVIINGDQATLRFRIPVGETEVVLDLYAETGNLNFGYDTNYFYLAAVSHIDHMAYMKYLEGSIVGSVEYERAG